ncbi:hypothetical protein J7M23_10130, partial [Candidatus Sumerlaeota bacterium]|nr:hypothetical protein [Candidatus Sumerlaeota bacterium]
MLRRAEQIVVFCLLIVLLLFFSPTKFIITFLAFGAFIGILIVQLNRGERRFILIWFAVALSLRLVSAFLINTIVPPSIDGFFFPDARSYHLWGERIAGMWRQGIFPDLYNDPMLRTFHTAYYRIIAGLYFVCGAHPSVPIIVNCLVSALSIIFVFYIAYYIFGTTQIARTAVIITALHPSMCFWSAFLLKDTLHVTFFIWASLIFYLLQRRYNYWLTLLLIVLLYFIFRLRAYGAFALLITFVGYLFFFTKHRKIIGVLSVVGIVVLVLASRIDYVATIYNRIFYSFLNLLPDEYNTSIPKIYLLFIAGSIKFLLSPFAWIIMPEFDIHLLLYPGQWFLYLFILPFAVVGIYFCLRDNRKETFILLFPIILSLYLFLLVYEGEVPRQRLFLEVIFIIFSAFGVHLKRSKTFFVIYYVILLAGIVLHLISIKVRYGTF